MFYRLKQFYWAIESLVKKDDYELLNRYLSKHELNLFMKINKSERQHSVRVCKSAIEYIRYKNISNIDMEKMCRCALLHDVGKCNINLNVFEKSIIVIINSITFGKFLKYNNRIANYYNHPEIGARLLDSINEVDLEIINCVKHHHDKYNTEKSIYLKILIICDNSN